MSNDGKRRVLIVIPFGVPCSGKSFIKDALKIAIAKERPDWSYDEISSDDMRRREMEKQKRRRAQVIFLHQNILKQLMRKFKIPSRTYI